MAVTQKNFENYKYVDDNGVEWTKRGEKEAARQAIDGSAAQDGDPWWFDGPRKRARSVTFQDPTTFRTKKVIIYTAAAYAAIDLGDTVDFFIEGSDTAVTYTAVGKNAEYQSKRAASRQLADHA
jgi:hypothetical protein